MAEPARVTFRKQVSDGNYGTEAAEISIDINPAEPITEAFVRARQHVNAALASSPSPNVRRALTPVPARQPPAPAVAAHIPTGEAYDGDEDRPF